MSQYSPWTEHLETRLAALLAGNRRRILGLVGPPGAGKSTLADAIVQRLGDQAQVVPMDGFHLAQEELQRLGRAHRKGAPDTFDAHGYVALLHRLRQQADDEVVYAPAFRRDIEEPVAGAIPVHPHTRLIVTEGNYLLLDALPWARVADCLDEAWYVEVDDQLRRERLVQRHVRFGRSPEAALAWVEQTDDPNARLIESGRHRAQAIIRC
jgi:pantothenate kinase